MTKTMADCSTNVHSPSVSPSHHFHSALLVETVVETVAYVVVDTAKPVDSNFFPILENVTFEI